MIRMGELLAEGKGKRIYATNDPGQVVVYFKDEAMAWQGLKRGRILGKGEVNNAVCRHIYELLERQGVKTHFIRQMNARQSLIRKVEIIPITVKVRNRAAGSLAQRLGLPTGTPLEEPVVELNLKDESLGSPLVNMTHIKALKLATEAEIRFITDTAVRINRILMDYMRDISVELIDFKLEFGRWEGEILLADEISADTSRFWDATTHEPMDIDRFRQDLGGAEQAYQELLRRMMGADGE